jgi:hypothetical protein
MGRLAVVRQGLAATTRIPAQMGPGQMGVPPIPGQIPRFAHPQINPVRQQVLPAHRLAPQTSAAAAALAGMTTTTTTTMGGAPLKAGTLGQPTPGATGIGGAQPGTQVPGFPRQAPQTHFPPNYGGFPQQGSSSSSTAREEAVHR